MSTLSRTLSDARIIYPILFVLVMIPLISPIGIPVAISKDVIDSKAYLDTLPAGSNILIGADMEAGNWPDLGSGQNALIRYCLAKGFKIVAFNTHSLAQGTAMFERTLTEIAPYIKDYKYGVDYVNLGFLPGEEVALANFCKDVWATCPKDGRGTPIDQIPMMKNIHSIKDFAVAISIGGLIGEYPERFLRQIQVPYKLKIISFSIAAAAPGIGPYVQSGQLIGNVASIRGGAEFEIATGMLGSGVIAMDSQSLAHLFIVLAIIAGNVLWLSKRTRGEKK